MLVGIFSDGHETDGHEREGLRVASVWSGLQSSPVTAHSIEQHLVVVGVC